MCSVGPINDELNENKNVYASADLHIKSTGKQGQVALQVINIRLVLVHQYLLEEKYTYGIIEPPGFLSLSCMNWMLYSKIRQTVLVADVGGLGHLILCTKLKRIPEMRLEIIAEEVHFFLMLVRLSFCLHPTHSHQIKLSRKSMHLILVNALPRQEHDVPSKTYKLSI